MRKFVAVAMVALAGCGGSSSDENPESDGTTSTTIEASASTTTTGSSGTTAELPDASEALAASGKDPDGHPILVGTVGGPVVALEDAQQDLDIGVAVAAASAPFDHEGTRAVKITLRVENRSATEQQTPEFALLCGGEETNLLSGGDYSAADPIPAGSKVDGERTLAFPSECDEPTITAYPLQQYEDTPVVHWSLSA